MPVRLLSQMFSYSELLRRKGQTSLVRFAVDLLKIVDDLFLLHNKSTTNRNRWSLIFTRRLCSYLRTIYRPTPVSLT